MSCGRRGTPTPRGESRSAPDAQSGPGRTALLLRRTLGCGALGGVRGLGAGVRPIDLPLQLLFLLALPVQFLLSLFVIVVALGQGDTPGEGPETCGGRCAATALAGIAQGSDSGAPPPRARLSAYLPLGFRYPLPAPAWRRLPPPGRSGCPRLPPAHADQMPLSCPRVLPIVSWPASAKRGSTSTAVPARAVRRPRAAARPRPILSPPTSPAPRNRCERRARSGGCFSIWATPTVSIAGGPARRYQPT